MDTTGPDTNRSVHLSASAGSGKTRALKERYLELLDELDVRGLSIDQAVAITFTDKAAAEIKERVMTSLREPMLKKIIRGSQDLRISTIHSFCMNLLKRYPLEAGLPPDFGILDERDKAYEVQQAIEASLEEMDRDPAVMAPLGRASAGEVIADVEFLLSIRSRLKRMEIDAGGPDGLLGAVRSGMGVDAAGKELAALLAGTEWRAAFERVAALINEICGDPVEGRAEEHLLLANTRDADNAYQVSERLADLFLTQKGARRANPAIPKGKRTPKVYDPYKEAYRTAQDLFIRFRERHALLSAGSASISLLRLFQRAEGLYQDAKLREGLLDFDDLEIYAYRLLRSQESPDVLYWLDRKILHFLVDEFQDTSDIQWAILDRLTEEIFAGQGADKGMPPTLFVVGDRKQSIYRFREANYRLIDTIRKKMERLPEALREIRTLDRNFRSAPEVVGAVNKVFGTLWKDDYQPSEAARSSHEGSVRLIEVLPMRQGEGGPEGLTEAEALAKEILRTVNAGTLIRVRAGDTWTERPVQFGDCAVLLQSRTKLKEYEAALLAQGVRFRVIGGIGFYEENEVQAIMSVLFYLWNQDDRLALAAALKSLLFGLDDRDLFALLQEGGSFAEGLRLSRPDIADTLEGWRTLAGVAPLSRLIHRIIGDTAAYVRFGRRSPQAVFNLDKLLDTARDFDRRGFTTLQDFVEWVKGISGSEQREATADMNLPGDKSAVSIMTVHKAKGLEFPVVFLPGMNQQPRSVTHGPAIIIEENEGRLRMASKDNSSPAYTEMWAREKGELQQEHQRLLYVAMTRACDHLVMIGALAAAETPVNQNTWLQYLHDAIPALVSPKSGPGARGLCFSYPDWQAEPLIEAMQGPLRAAQGPQEQPVVTDPAAVLGNIAPLPASHVERWTTATDHLAREKELVLELSAMREGRPVSPLTRGNINHRSLEAYATTGSFDLRLIAKEFPEIMALGPEERERFLADVETVLRGLMGSEELAWVFKQQPGAYAELPFLYRKGNEIISGVIDRLVVKEGAGYVIDYKSIAVESDDALQTGIDHYRPQIRLYCEAAKELFGLASVEGYLLFLDSRRLALTVKV
ncbi:MAG: UvrD-helicase domain-containing protein [Nitrospirae bacterium]|nr:UvrD-helicase domain-containing protein [Nitrospirota bacterium]